MFFNLIWVTTKVLFGLKQWFDLVYNKGLVWNWFDNGLVLLGRELIETGNFVSSREIGEIRIRKGK